MAFARRLALLLSLTSLSLGCQPKQEVSAEPKKAAKKEGAKTDKGHDAKAAEKSEAELQDPGKFIVPFAWEASKDEPLALTRQFLGDVLTDNQAYMEHGDIYQQIDTTRFYNDPVNQAAYKTVIAEFLCPTNPARPATSIGIPGIRRMKLYDANAPTAMNAAVPSESWPA